LLRAETSTKRRKVFFQLKSEQVDRWCWDDIARQCIPAGFSGYWNGLATVGTQLVQNW